MSKPALCFMVDIESLGLDPHCLITVIAVTPFMSDHSWEGEPVKYNLNGSEQKNRTIDFNTVLWWFEQEDAAIKSMARSMRSGLNNRNMDMLLALVSDLQAKAAYFSESLNDCEFWFRGPQFDCVAIETLLKSLGIKAPWKYDMVCDLRTHMRSGGVTLDDVTPSRDFLKHDAGEDTLFQIECHRAALQN